MSKMTEITCACGCGRKKEVRTADVKRGWGKYYSKRCKAVAQNKIRPYQPFEDELDDSIGGLNESGYFGHGQN